MENRISEFTQWFEIENWVKCYKHSIFDFTENVKNYKSKHHCFESFDSFDSLKNVVLGSNNFNAKLETIFLLQKNRDPPF